jgi:hypothetical protein
VDPSFVAIRRSGVQVPFARRQIAFNVIAADLPSDSMIDNVIVSAPRFNFAT